MHPQCCQKEEHQCVQIQNTPMPTPATTPDIAAVSDDDSSSDSSPHVEMS